MMKKFLVFLLLTALVLSFSTVCYSAPMTIDAVTPLLEKVGNVTISDVIAIDDSKLIYLDYVVPVGASFTFDCPVNSIYVSTNPQEKYEDPYLVACQDNPVSPECVISFNVVDSVVQPGASIKFLQKGHYVIYYDVDSPVNLSSIKLTVGDENTLSAPENTAKRTDSRVYVNNKLTSFQAFNINDNNYFKLRDLAKAFSGTSKQFEVSWDEANSAISVISNTPYTTVGGELLKGDQKDALYAPFSGKFSFNSSLKSVTAYTINDNNYFKLRDLCKLLDIGVEWREDLNAILLNSDLPYTE